MTESGTNLHDMPSWMGRAAEEPASLPADELDIHEAESPQPGAGANVSSSAPRFEPVDSAPGAPAAGEGTIVDGIPAVLEEPTERIGPEFPGPEQWAVPPAETGSSTSAAAVAADADETPPHHGSALTTLLFTWASVATLLAVWLWLRWPEARSPLENLPDDGVYQNGKQEIVSPLEKLSSREMFRLGETRQIGALEITPLAIEHRSVRLLPDKFHTDPVLVLRLRIRNVSEDQTFYPTDPAYLYPDPKKKLKGVAVFDRTGYTYSFLHSASAAEKVLIPFDLAYSQGFRIEGQSFAPLGPGELVETLVISGEDAPAGLDGPMVWRIKLRKGLAANGRGIATVIGVAFTAGDVVTPTS